MPTANKFDGVNLGNKRATDSRSPDESESHRGPAIWNTKLAYVAFLDVLGFRQLVDNNTHSDLEQVYSEVLMNDLAIGLSNQQYVSYEENGQAVLTNDVTATPVNSIIVSDNIIAWSDDNSVDAFRNIVSVVRGMMAHSCLSGIPLRGAIDLGPVSWLQGRFASKTLNVQQSIFGKGLCRVVELEKLQQWSGCVVSEAAIDHFKVAHEKLRNGGPLINGLDAMIRRKELCVYDVPFKTNNGQARRSMHVVDWVNHPEVRISTRSAADAFAGHQKLKGSESGIPSDILSKITNTVEFVRKVSPFADLNAIDAHYATLNA
jgi:hypothetical protein